MEYVRVCDVYGAGFFYIPGTETCLQISGMVRYQIDWDENDDGWRKFARAEVNFDARSETELGTLGAYIKLRSNSSSTSPIEGPLGRDLDGDGIADEFVDIPNEGNALSQGPGSNTFVQSAIISLGGLSMGLAPTLWDAGLSGEFDDGGGDSRVHFMSYTFAGGNGFTATLALEEADDNYDYTPNILGKVGIAQG